MENLISKELLLELKLFDNIENRDWRYEVNENTLKIIYNITNCFSGNCFTINIYELGFKLKEWSYSKCNEIISYTEGSEVYQTQLDKKVTLKEVTDEFVTRKELKLELELINKTTLNIEKEVSNIDERMEKVLLLLQDIKLNKKDYENYFWISKNYVKYESL